MNQTAKILPLNSEFAYFGPAVLTNDEQYDGSVKVNWQSSGLPYTATARIAISRFTALKAGDEVLITAQSPEEVYITGLLSKPKTANTLEFNGPNSAYAKLSENDESSSKVLEVYSSDNDLVFSYNPVTQSSIVNIPKGNLEIRTEDGDIMLNAANKVSLNGQSLEMQTQNLKLQASYANLVFDRLETATDTLIENAKNVFRSVKQLTQLRTGRMRTLVDETYHFKANKAMLKAEEDFKINADKIHLG